jgi:hypothetical protein
MMGEIFTLESECIGYEAYWDLEWCGDSFKKAISFRNHLLDNNPVYEKTRITVWINGVINQVFYYNGRVEIKE